MLRARAALLLAACALAPAAPAAFAATCPPPNFGTVENFSLARRAPPVLRCAHTTHSTRVR
jgi:hypothetical protein